MNLTCRYKRSVAIKMNLPEEREKPKEKNWLHKKKMNVWKMIYRENNSAFDKNIPQLFTLLRPIERERNL